MLPIMLQRNGEKAGPSLERQRNRDALLEAKDRSIAELKEQVALLRSELERKDAILSRIAEDMGELLPARVSDADGPQAVALREVCNGKVAMDAREGYKKPGPARLPNGYRLVAIASDAWVLVTNRGLRVAGYRGELDLWKVALDARKHHQHE
jgi:uncharacterized small protein (DUF1192 family)